MAKTANERVYYDEGDDGHFTDTGGRPARGPQTNSGGRGTSGRMHVGQEAANDAGYRDEERGIQNARRHTVQSDFEREKSIQAQVYGQERADREQAAYDERYAEQEQLMQMAAAVAEEQAITVAESRITGVAEQKLGKELSVVKGAKAARKSVIIYELTIVGIAYLIQLAFAIISLAGFGLKALVVSTVKSTIVGQLANKFVKLFGGDISNWVPGESIGWVAWGLVAILTLCLFVGYLIWFFMNGINVLMKSHFSFLITTVLFALNFLPVTNLGPWLVIWVVYIEMDDLVEMVKGTVNTIQQATRMGKGVA